MLSALSILCVQARRKTGLTDLKKHFNGCEKLLQHHCNSFSPIVESNFNKINISQITCKAIFNSCLQKLFFLISYTKKRETLKKRVSLLKVKRIDVCFYSIIVISLIRFLAPANLSIMKSI